MFKIRTVVLDITGTAMEWLDANGDEKHMELCEVLTLYEDSPIPIWELNDYDNWDILLVFERGMKSQIDALLSKIGITDERVIYPLDTEGSLLENRYLASYIFGDYIRRIIHYLTSRVTNDKYAIVSIPNFTYLNVATDNVILPDMIYNQKNWSENEMELFYNLSKKYYSFDNNQDVFCDIGANIGTTSIYFKNKLDKDIKILAFEPSNENYKLLLVNAMINDIDIKNHFFEKMGLSDTSTKAYLTYDVSNPGGSSMDLDKEGKKEEITLVSFDDYLKKKSIEANRIKYLWIDVEGFEARFLIGARETINQINVPVFMEFVPRFYKNKEGEFDLLINELKRHFNKFICIQNPDYGEMSIDKLWEKQNDIMLQWDIFLLK